MRKEAGRLIAKLLGPAIRCFTPEGGYDQAFLNAPGNIFDVFEQFLNPQPADEELTVDQAYLALRILREYDKRVSDCLKPLTQTRKRRPCLEYALPDVERGSKMPRRPKGVSRRR
jgi:hypothetical protein